MNPTLIGVFSILVWGIALPVVRMVEEQIGALAIIGFTFASTGVMGLLNHVLRRKPLPDPAIFRNPFFYGRWLFFVLHEGLLIVGISIVQRGHMPFLILINYLWPTAIIVCSVLLAGVKITRWWSFLLGSFVVIASMSIEILGPAGFSPELFTKFSDCLAYLMTFAGAVSWGMYSALSRRAGDATGGGTLIPLFQLTLGVALPISFMPGMATWHNLTPLYGILFGGYCVLQFLAYQSWDYGMRRGNVVALSLFADFIPWLSLLSAALLLGVDIGHKTVVSAITLVMGAMITRYGTLQKKTSPPPFEMPEP